MSDVFISYSRRDKVFTQKLYEALTTASRDVWADWDDIPASSDWDAEIKQGIQETNSVLFVLSPEWIKSNECRKEMVHAVAMGKRLFPILYLPVDPKDVPPELAKINWVYLRDADDFDKGFQTLCSAMETDLDWIKMHTRIQIRALEWDKKNRSSSFALRGEDLTEGERFVAGAANKNPVPTTLQSEYILASRKDATKRQRQTLAGVTVALVISIVLGVVASSQRQEAVKQATIARSQLFAVNIKLDSSKVLHNLLLGIESYKMVKDLSQPNKIIAEQALRDSLSQVNGIPLIGHDGAINTLAFSPDKRWLATGSDDKTARLWNIQDPSAKPTVLRGHEGPIYALAFSPDGR
jgi:TIR domain-containing protein/WD40 domain-containing protein